MAAPKPYLQFRVYSLPDSVSYRDSYPADVTGDGGDFDTDRLTAMTALQAARLSSNRNIYTYISGATMDYWLRGTSTANPYSLLAQIDDATVFSASLELNEICTWSVGKEFPAGDPRVRELVEAARTPGAWAAWHVSTDDDPSDAIEDFLEGNVLSAPPPPRNNNPLLFPSSDNPSFADEAGTPSFLARGGGGPVIEVRVRVTSHGEMVTIAGTCWGKMLQQTVHLNEMPFLPSANQTGSAGFQSLISGMLLGNSEYALPQLDDDEIALLGSDLLGDARFRTDLERAGIDAASAFRTKTPVALFTIISAARASARRRLDAEFGETPFVSSKGGMIQPGNHNMFRSYQRLGERTGLVFNTGMPLVLWDAPSSVALEWGPGDYFEAAPAWFRPEATAWLTSHVDRLRNWDVYTPDVGLIGDFGEIQAVNLSTAVRALSVEADIFQADDVLPTELNPGETTEEAARRLSGELILQQIKAQNAGLAWVEANNVSVDVDVKWDVGTRFGLEWNLGDRVRVTTRSGLIIPDPDDPALVVRKAVISLAEDGDWIFEAGLGPRSTIAPGFRRRRGPRPEALAW